MCRLRAPDHRRRAREACRSPCTVLRYYGRRYAETVPDPSAAGTALKLRTVKRIPTRLDPDRLPAPLRQIANKHLHWLPGWLRDRATKALRRSPSGTRHLLFALCDHFEPLPGDGRRRGRAWSAGSGGSPGGASVTRASRTAFETPRAGARVTRSSSRVSSTIRP